MYVAVRGGALCVGGGHTMPPCIDCVYLLITMVASRTSRAKMVQMPISNSGIDVMAIYNLMATVTGGCDREANLLVVTVIWNISTVSYRVLQSFRSCI